MVLAALAVPHQGVAHTELLQHGGRHLSGVGTFFVLRHILDAQRNRRILHQRLHLGQVDRRNGHTHTALQRGRQPLANARQQLGIGLQAAIHLPVANNQLLLHVFAHHVKTILPMS